MKKEQKKVRQTNELVEANYKTASIGEARLIRLLVAQITPDDEDFKTYRIAIKDFAKMFKLNERDGRLYGMIEKTIDDLLSRRIEIRQDKDWYKTNWLSGSRYIHGSGYIEVRFDSGLKPYLLKIQGKLNNFTVYELEQTVRFKSIYSFRLFELIKKESFKEKWSKNSIFLCEFAYIDLRLMLAINEGEYSLFSNFKNRVIAPAEKEINLYTSINIFQIDYVTTERKVTGIIFHCEANKEKTAPKEALPLLAKTQAQQSDTLPDDVQELILMGVSEVDAFRLRKKYGVAQVVRNIGYTKATQKAGKVRDSITGYVVKAIELDYGGGLEQKKQFEEAKLKERQDQEDQVQQEAEEEAKIRKQENDLVKSRFWALPDNEQEAIRQAYIGRDSVSSFARSSWQKACKKAEDENSTPERVSVTVQADFFGFYKVYDANLKLDFGE